jgi:hypothetical protein
MATTSKRALGIDLAGPFQVVQGGHGNFTLLGRGDGTFGAAESAGRRALTSTKTMVPFSLAMMSISPALGSIVGFEDMIPRPLEKFQRPGVRFFFRIVVAG